MSQDFLNDIQKFINTHKKQTENGAKVNTSTQIPQAAPAQGSCTDLINEAISTLNEALTECVCPPTPACDCSGTILSCLPNTNVLLFSENFTGNATIQAQVCTQCTLDGSTVLFNFIRDENAGFITFTSLTVDKVCCTPSSFISVSGTGALSIDDFIISNLNFTFAFGKIIGDQCFFTLDVGSILAVGGTISCTDANISITPCTSTDQLTSKVSKKDNDNFDSQRTSLQQDFPLHTQQISDCTSCTGLVPVSHCPPSGSPKIGVTSQVTNLNTPIFYGDSHTPNTFSTVNTDVTINCDCTGCIQICIQNPGGSTALIYKAEGILGPTQSSGSPPPIEIDSTGTVRIGEKFPIRNTQALLKYNQGCSAGCCLDLNINSSAGAPILFINTFDIPCPTVVTCTSSTEE